MPPTRPMTQSPRAAASHAGNRLRPSLPPITANGSMRWLATLLPDGYALTSSHHHPTTIPPPLPLPTHHPSISPTHPSIPLQHLCPDILNHDLIRNVQQVPAS